MILSGSIWLVVSTHLNNISQIQIGHLPQFWVKLKTWNPHLVFLNEKMEVERRSNGPTSQPPNKIQAWNHVAFSAMLATCGSKTSVWMCGSNCTANRKCFKALWLRCGRRLPLPSVASGAARPVNKLKKVGQGRPMQEGSLASSETKAYHSPSNSCKKLVTMRLLRLTVHVYVYDTFSRAGWRTTVWAFFGWWGRRAISNKTTFTILHLLKP